MKNNILIKGIDTASLIDYPGNIAAIIFFGGCNFNCDYCFNRGLVENIDNIPDISLEDCFNILDKKRKYIDGVVISGGEPTIQRGLIEFIKELRKNGFKVKLDTNGYKPDVLQDIIDQKLVQYIAMDIKAPLNYYSEVAKVNINIDKIAKSIELIKNSGIEYEFRSTIWRDCPIVKYPEELKNILNGVDNYYLQNFQDFNETNLHESMSLKELNNLMNAVKPMVKNLEARGAWL